MTAANHQPQLLQALNLWKEITGIDPSATSMRLSDWHLRETFDELQEAIDLDPTEVTANLLLAYFINTYLADRAVSLLDLLNGREEIEARLAKPRELLAILNRPEVVDSRESFIAALRTALGRYEAAEREDVTKLLGQPDDIAILRRDALRSIARLRVDQFLDGNSEAADFRPVYNRTVHQWWNINSMLAAATRMPSGVSLNLIRHPDAFQSYFCFTIRNGGNLFVLTDVPEYSHPLQGFMSRRPDRALSKRAARNWFPYDLLGLEYDEEAKRLYIKESEQRGLVAYQNAALPLQPVAELPAAELVWVSMMFDLIVEKFWRRGFKAPALSYTAEMLKSETALLEVAKTANLPVPAYQPVGLPALTKHDVSADASTEEEIGRKYHEPNRWMEERYGDRVSDNVLNLLGAPEQVFALEHTTGEASTVDPKFHSLTDWQQSDLLAGRKQLEKVDATSFGSREQINRNGFHSPEHLTRRFFKRHDLATDEKLYHTGVTLGQRQENGRPLCYLNGTKASYWALFHPGNAEELALLAGCAVADLPDVLQHWNLLRSYTGNSILSRVDPMIWRAKNPWIKLNLSVRIGFSKRGMAQIDKQPVERPNLANLLSEAPK